jgi:hypothetical protein
VIHMHDAGLILIGYIVGTATGAAIRPAPRVETANPCR